jgi:peroxiredoxin family protein
MYLGIVATNESAEDHVVGLAYAAVARGWQCRCFLTDTGVRLLRSAHLLELARTGKLRVDACEHSWELYGSGAAPDGVGMTGQIKNAELAHECDKAIVL